MLSSGSNGISLFPPCLDRNNHCNSSSSFRSLNINSDNHEDLLSYYLSVASIIESEASEMTSVSTQNYAPSTVGYNHTKTPQVSSIIRQECRARKKTTKRDRHSKIFTAQGPRDRRVRLSIEISRKFFGLQDLLGFDKASLTLEWLLTKSKEAIRELLQTKQLHDDGDANIARCIRSLSENDGHFVDNEEEEEANKNNNDEYSEKTASSKRKRSKQIRGGEKKKQPKMITELDRLAKESRAKARERARERTRKKNLFQEQQKLLFLPDPITFNHPSIPNSQTRGLTRWFRTNFNGSCNSPDSSKQSTVSSLNEDRTPTPTPPSAEVAEGFFFVNPRISSEANVTVEEMFLQQCGSIRNTIVKPAASSSPSLGFHIWPSVTSKEAVSSDFNIWPSATTDHHVL